MNNDEKFEICELLLKNGANKNHKNISNQTPYQFLRNFSFRIPKILELLNN